MQQPMGALGVDCPLLPSAFNKAFTPSHIKEAWKNVGLWPFAPFVIEDPALRMTGGGLWKLTSPKKGSLLDAGFKVIGVSQEEIESKKAEKFMALPAPITSEGDSEERVLKRFYFIDQVFFLEREKEKEKNQKKSSRRDSNPQPSA